jgi:type IV pilus assembly protein PilE
VAYAGAGREFTLTATPNFTDAQCGNLGLNQAGQRTITGTGTVAQCWAR